MSPSPNPAWIPELTADETYDFDLDQAKQILDDAGYTDSDGNGIREYEGSDIVLQVCRFARNRRTRSHTRSSSRAG